MILNVSSVFVDEVVTYGVIQELMEKMDSLNETLNQEITDLKQENENLNLEMMNLTQKINKLESMCTQICYE